MTSLILSLSFASASVKKNTQDPGFAISSAIKRIFCYINYLPVLDSNFSSGRMYTTCNVPDMIKKIGHRRASLTSATVASTFVKVKI